jgi:hypothetical protein
LKSTVAAEIERTYGTDYSSTETEYEYDRSTPYIFDFLYDSGDDPVYDPLFSYEEWPIFNASFELPEGIRAIPTTLVELYVPDKVIDGWVQYTNAYATSRASVANRKEVSKYDVLRWIAAVQCTCKLPAKEDYLPGSRSDVLPVHPLVRINRYTLIAFGGTYTQRLKKVIHSTFLNKKKKWKQKRKKQRTVQVPIYCTAAIHRRTSHLDTYFLLVTGALALA